jgi:hypothetical protein
MEMNSQHSEADRVQRYTDPEVQHRIDQQIENNVRFYAVQTPDVVAGRIEQLQREWSIERYLQVNVASVGFVTALLGLTVSKKYVLLTCTALGFFLYHATRGWDQPLPMLRRLGIRTRGEIDREIYALKAIRGDFRAVPEAHGEAAPPVREAIAAVSMA